MFGLNLVLFFQLVLVSLVVSSHTQQTAHNINPNAIFNMFQVGTPSGSPQAECKMAEVDTFQDLVAARVLLRTSLEKSRSVATALEKAGPRLEEIKQSLTPLEADQKFSLAALGGYVSRALGPAAAVVKVFNAIHCLEKSVLSYPSSDLHGYLVVVKRLEEALRFLAENCGLAIRWLEDVVEFLKDNAVSDDHPYLSNVTKCLKILRELQASKEHACLDGGLLSTAYDNLESEFGRLLRENMSPASPIVIQKLQVIIERLSANNRLKNCISTYISVRSSEVRACLEALGLEYLEISTMEFDNWKNKESGVSDWCRHLEYAVKNVLEGEYQLCNEVFQKIGSESPADYFVRICIQSGFLAFIQFGNTVAESKKEAIKLFKLLKIFHTLNELRLDFNRLFGEESCVDIQIPTRNLIKKVIEGACEIFWELLPQVEVHRGTSPPPDGSVPRVVKFVVDCCNQLLQDDYRPTMIQVLEIHHNWRHQKFQEQLLSEEVCNILEAIELNLDAWSRAYEDTQLSHIFLMNNHCHLYNALEGTRLGDLVGGSQLREHQKFKDYYASIYLRESWGMLPGLLSHDDDDDDDTTFFSSGRATTMARSLAKKKLKEFNQAIDGIYKKQSNWVVADECLRKRICQLVVDAIVPRYRSYIQNYGHLIDHGIVYTEKGLMNMLSSMFQN